jgi:hypothetical protein
LSGGLKEGQQGLYIFKFQLNPVNQILSLVFRGEGNQFQAGKPGQGAVKISAACRDGLPPFIAVEFSQGFGHAGDPVFQAHPAGAVPPEVYAGPESNAGSQRKKAEKGQEG